MQNKSAASPSDPRLCVQGGPPAHLCKGAGLFLDSVLVTPEATFSKF